VSLLVITKRGVENWRSLSNTERYNAVYWVARAIHRWGISAGISTDAVSVSCGYRTRKQGRGQRVCRDEPVLVVGVRKKIRRNVVRKQRRDWIPERIQLSVPVSGRKRVLAIPVDVVTREPVPVAQAMRQGIAMRSQFTTGRNLRGSVCALVRNTLMNDPKRYLLTCHHVACLSLLTPRLTPEVPASSYSMAADSQPDDYLGETRRYAEFGVNVLDVIDAALITLDPDALEIVNQPSYWTLRPASWARTPQELSAETSQGVYLVAKGDKSASGTFLRHEFSQAVRYGSGNRIAIIKEIIMTRLNRQTTAGGDSGGAIVSPNGTLLGMHIAGDGRLSYAIPAYHLLRTGTFSPSIELA